MTVDEGAVGAASARLCGEHADVVELLDLEVLDRDLFRANAVFTEPFSLYGGQVAAQGLRAAGFTVPAGRLPHSLHGYYLRGGDPSQPVVFRVDRDRDGRSFSARRVVAVQAGEVIFSMAVSFHAPEDGPDHQVEAMPDAGDPADLEPCALPRVRSIEGRRPPQPYPGLDLPTRFWARCTVPLGDDPILHAAVLTYLSDTSTGLAPLTTETHRSGATLDHAVWFHRPVRMDDWVLLEMAPHSVARGRGWYTGAVYDSRGRLVASLTQEALFRSTRR